MKKKISFIGAGKMAEAVISGIIKSKLFSPKDIFVSDKLAERHMLVSASYKVNVSEDNNKAAYSGDVIVLSVKPQNMKAVLNQAGDSIENSKLVISIAAGVPLSYLEKNLRGCPIIRVMPNNPCLIGEGISAIAKGKSASPADLQLAEKIFGSVGKTVIIDEKYMDAVTGLSGSGPAFVYEFIDALVDGGIKAGLSKEDALDLAKQTVSGAVKTVIETGRPLRELIDMVTSPGGTTIEGMKVLEEAKFRQIIADTVGAATARARQISAEFGG